MSLIDIMPPSGFQCGFQSNLDFNNARYCFKYEYGNNGKRCLLVGEDKDIFINWFKNLPEDQRKMYELIRNDDIVAEYYDIDFTIENKMHDSDIEDLSHEIIKVLLEARNDISDQTISKKDIIVLSSHTSSKLSLHVISKKTYIKNNKLHGVFALDVFKKISELNDYFNIDTSIYSNNRCFRMFLNHKHGKTNNLILFAPHMYSFASFEETWVVLTHRDLSVRLEIRKYSEEDIDIRQYHDPSEKLDRGLDVILEKFLEEHPYLQAELDHSKSINRINRVDHTTRPCLIDPTDKHSTENMFWYIRNNHLYISCFCKKGKPICLGMRTGLCKVDIPPEPFDYATHCSDDFKQYIDLGVFFTLYDKRRTGKGKTTSAMNYAKNFKRVLLVHHRLTLDDDYIQKYPEFTSYQKGINNDMQTACFNSLAKIDIGRYDLIIIDEIRSILKQTEMKDMVFSTHTLFNILENINVPLIMLDANMTNSDIEFISRYRPDPSRVVIHDTDIVTTKNVFINMDVDMKCNHFLNETLSRIDTNIRNKQKVVIVYNRSIEYMNSILEPYVKDYRVLHINKLTRKTSEMDSNLWFDNYDIIAYSPTISEGVSVNDSRFKDIHAYGIFTSTSCPAESVSQMIARFRAIENFTINLDCKRTKNIPVFYSKSDVLPYINSNISRLNRINQSHYNIKREGKSIVVIEDEFFELFSKNLFEQSMDYRNYEKTLKQKLVNNGYNVYDDLTQLLSDEDNGNIDNIVQDLKTNERDRIIKGILDASTLTFLDYTILTESGVSSEEDDFRLRKFQIVHSVNILPDYITENVVRTFIDPNTRNIIRNIKNCFGFTRDNQGDIQRIPTGDLISERANYMIENCDLSSTFLDQKKISSHFSISKMDWINSRIQELGFKYLLSPEGVDNEIFKDNMERIMGYFKDSRNYKDYIASELLFGKYYNRELHSKITSKFIKEKIFGLVGMRIRLNKADNKMYQQINVGVRLCDKSRQHPSILDLDLTDCIIEQYDFMFMRAMTDDDYCNVCNKTIKGGVTFRHLNSKNHKKNAG